VAPPGSREAGARHSRRKGQRVPTPEPATIEDVAEQGETPTPDREIPPPFAPVGFVWDGMKTRGINQLRIAGAEELIGEGGALIDATGREPLGGAQFLMVAQGTRAQHTFETVIGAARMGRGVQAAMLNRGLLDDVLDIHWAAAHPEEAPERADQHDRLIALAEHDAERPSSAVSSAP
jgi:hypothetical protein